MKVLMYGWEYPPLITGGLGVACKGIVTALSRYANIVFVLPTKAVKNLHQPNVTFIDALIETNSLDILALLPKRIHPYATSESYWNHIQHPEEHNARTIIGGGKYDSDLVSAVKQYALLAGSLSRSIEHQVIHAHDWLTILAGIEAKKHSHKPLVFHVHSLEPDRSGSYVNQQVFEIEKQGLKAADCIMAVSQYTKNAIIKYYGINPNKIYVTYNGIDPVLDCRRGKKQTAEKMILFVGRLTHQKGPFFFLDIAERILSKRQDVHFVIVGSGDMMQSMIDHVAYLKLGSKIHFTGFLDSESTNRLFSIADAYVMTSISEPFGLTCLEAISHKVPIIISKQTGVIELIPHLLKSDFWDTQEMASKILSVLDHPVLHKELCDQAFNNIKGITWEKCANTIRDIYHQIGVF